MKIDGHTEAEIDDRRKLSERRLSSRKRLFRAGKALWPNGDATACIVHNVSATGAKLEAFGPIPNSFDLVVDGDSIRLPCSVVWRKANLIGVRFQVEMDLAPLLHGRTKPIGGFRQYVETCESLAQRVSPSDREILLEMAKAWKRAIRLIRANER